ncbi:hypothetical protein [Chlamydia abortus]|uniref:Uncharacterized protein n=1 Tax=Chlamydia abortus (strain DSM 27085 / S26/3) TaxID=218497 RepID=Q5L5K9_CHLAB|nr:hypothetical protein [Chlamydia abortus]ASD30761.1 hypothetical protein CEF07_03345 [Chlamydia abortus]AUS60111.1 uncharacterized protein CHAB577_0690 [Chlamydia abortus]QRR31401.1 hypothetical protein JS522_03310 [Chlamydia abortus]CAH64082.1 conserved hypothetical protein [Chlamydia abortus S26/3]CED80687.1 conserved hypothetical protein [Chlamydia abortus]
MRIVEHAVLIINHCHTPTGELDHYFDSNKQYVLQNPLYRSYFELFLSYLPIFSTFTGVRALLGISNIENVLLIPTRGYSTICSIGPCVDIHEAVPKIRKHAWLEIFGIKSFATIFQAIFQIIRVVIRYFNIVCGCVPPTSADSHLVNLPLPPPKSAQEELEDFLGPMQL